MAIDKIGISVVTKRPKEIDKASDRMNHCVMIALSREGKVFYSEPENFKCALARFNLGLQKRVDAFRHSVIKYLISYGHASDEEAATMCLESKKTLSVSRKYFIYFPLDKRPLEPDLVVLIGNPEEIMGVVYSIVKKTGEPISACISGTAAMCGEITALPLVTELPNVSLGCCGCRKWGKIMPHEVIMGIPIKDKYKEYKFFKC